eukprot:5082186-Prymnesium_polylepis.2
MSTSTTSTCDTLCSHALKFFALALAQSSEYSTSPLSAISLWMASQCTQRGSTMCAHLGCAGRCARAKATARAAHVPHLAPSSATTNGLRASLRNTAW